MNEHDSERMTGILEGNGCAQAGDVESADMVILNTCSIREKAEQKFYSELGRLKALKDGNPNLKIVVSGCIAQQEGSRILSRAPYVDIVFGPSDIVRLADMVDRNQEVSRPVVETGGDPEYHRKSIPTTRRDRIKAWVSIMYGCDNFCTYCVVPYLRGRERSRPADDIVREVRELGARGYKEVTLLGQNVNSYGRGIERNTSFPELLGLLNGVPGIERIRFVTSHPRDLSHDLIFAMRDLPKVCESVHLPIQSGSDSVLRSMNRKYGRQEYLDKVNRLRKAVPDLALTTDIIVGFPGETEQDLEMTLELLEEVQYDSLFAFKYSKRPETAAIKLPGHLPEEVKEERLARVLELQKGISLRRNRELVGTVREVLVDGFSKKGGMVTGRTRENKVVNFPGPSSLIGTVVQAVITAAGMNSLTGQKCE